MLGSSLRRFSKDLAVDLGTANIRVADRSRRLLVEAPAVVAIEQREGASRVFAVGEAAKEMLGRTPEHIVAAHPVQAGRIADYELAEVLIRDCVVRALTNRPIVRPRMVVSVPQDTSEVQRRAVQDSARAAGGREVALVGKAVAAAIGADLPVGGPSAVAVVDLGAGTTEVVVLALGGVLAVAATPTAGRALDAAIQRWAEERRDLELSERTAELVKLRVGRAAPGEEEGTLRVNGRDLHTGIPREVDITTEDVAGAIQPALDEVVATIRKVLAEISPEAAADVARDGLVLTGGSALMPGLARAIQDRTGLPTRVADDPCRATVLGAARLLDDPDALARLAL